MRLAILISGILIAYSINPQIITQDIFLLLALIIIIIGVVFGLWDFAELIKQLEKRKMISFLDVQKLTRGELALQENKPLTRENKMEERIEVSNKAQRQVKHYAFQEAIDAHERSISRLEGFVSNVKEQQKPPTTEIERVPECPRASLSMFLEAGPEGIAKMTERVDQALTELREMLF